MNNQTQNLEQMPQWVCLECGYNMIGEMPDVCPFCGASHDKFMPWDEAEQKYRVTAHDINNDVSQLLSVPKLGLEHAAYRIETDAGNVWIDSPSAFNRDLKPVNAILFTHHHFMGASNQYRRLWGSQVWLHEMDAKHPLVASFDVDKRFNDDFNLYGIDAYHIGGHTPGFTLYIYRDVLFICDYVFLDKSALSFNPYGSQPETLRQVQRIHEIVKSRYLVTVCGYNYVMNFEDWLVALENLIRN
ncbi:rubredoxin-type Fe(Cys)4 protein [Methyloglobulus morosus KoM1]|uniref:Rubredoxin-type Fe(Cys)4 protein n=1 Tax=Methyloglobulus morosus KoM1 TaxID=1116472 RepID=V5BF84_9GAMM|nr:rubredoxin-type Fe(Cys)4 protein [Methyloglobulus morosus]ESS66409.1 rubredoxin-type Fe(Cys)4 protein [Methyloglobulus morosus KoM1]